MLRQYSEDEDEITEEYFPESYLVTDEDLENFCLHDFEEETSPHHFLAEDAIAMALTLVNQGDLTGAAAWREVAVKQTKIKPDGSYRLINPK